MNFSIWRFPSCSAVPTVIRSELHMLLVYCPDQAHYWLICFDFNVVFLLWLNFSSPLLSSQMQISSPAGIQSQHSYSPPPLPPVSKPPLSYHFCLIALPTNVVFCHLSRTGGIATVAVANILPLSVTSLSSLFKLNIDEILAHYPCFVCKLLHKSASDLVILKKKSHRLIV